MKVTLLDHTDDPEYKIGLFSAKCYDSKTDRDSCIKRAKHCKSSGHLATLRFASATVEIEGVSRVFSHQMVRHAHLSYLQRSQRYVAEKDINYIDPDALKEIDINDQLEWATIQDHAESLYLRLTKEKKMKKEDARFILPQGCDTSMVVTGNFQAWLDFINLRSDAHAQKEIRDVAIEIKRLLSEISPNIFGE